MNELLHSSGPGADSASYGYDADGNRTSKGTAGGGGGTYTYDASGRLVDAYVSDDGGHEFHAYYDARGRRLAKTEDDTTTRFRYDGGTNFQELDDTGFVKTELVRAGGLGGGIGSVLYSDTRTAATSTTPASTKTECFAYNAVGSTVALTDGAGTPTQRTMYEAFGEVVITDGDSTNNRLRNTKERDQSIGLDNDGQRYYDPATGTYTQRDPIGYKDGLNVYASVHANPINQVDPLGLNAWTTFLGTFVPSDEMEAMGYSRTDGTIASVQPGAESAAARYNAVPQLIGGGMGMAISAPIALSPSPDPATHIAGGLGFLKSGEIAASAWDTIWNGPNATGVPTLADAVTMAGRAAGLDPMTADQLGNGADNVGSLVPIAAGAYQLSRGMLSRFGGDAAGEAAGGQVAQGQGVAPDSSSSSINAGAALRTKLSALEGAQESAASSRTLPDGRVRYYGPETPARTAGPTRGASYVTEHNPNNGNVRSWMESYDQEGEVNRVHLKMINGQQVNTPHYPPTGSESGK